MANEPTTNPPPPSDTKRFVRTFAQDVARLSGKPLPPEAARPTAPPIPQSAAPQPAPAASAAATPTEEPKALADELRAELEGATEPVPSSEPMPVQQVPKEAPAAAPSYREPIPEMPPAYVIPKAPTTSESREDVLARLKRKVAAEQAQEAVILPKAPTTSESREQVLARLKAAAQKENAPKQKAPLAPLTQAPTGPGRIHTYKTDFAEHVEKKGASAISVIAAQSDAGGNIDAVVFKEKRPFPVAIVGGFLLILIGGGALFAAYSAVTNRPIPILTPRVPSLITADASRELSGTTGYPLAELASFAEQPLGEGEVLIPYLALATTSDTGVVSRIPLEGGELIGALRLPMPDILARSIRDASTLGLIRAGGEQRAFFILRVDSFERSFAGMLAWEGSIATDLALLYPEHPAVITASTTPSDSGAPLVFSDEVLANRDVRTLRDGAGRIVLMYGFHDKETIIIARNETAYRALVERLAASKGR